MPATIGQIEELYTERYAGFRRALASMLGDWDAAHDVVQEAFTRAVSKRQTFRGDAPLAAWVWRIAVRAASDHQRRPIDLPFEESSDCWIAEPARDPDLELALRSLPPRRRLIFFLRYFAGMTHHEIAAACEVSEGTVAASLTRARADLATALEGSLRHERH